MKKNIVITAALLASALTLSGCGGSEPELTGVQVEPATGDTTTASAVPTATKAPRSPRGALMKKVGEPSRILVKEGSDDWAVNFTVTDIQLDPQCTSPQAEPSENGHLIAISVEAATAPEPIFSEVVGSLTFNAHSWKVIAANGTTVNTVVSNASSYCLTPAEHIPAMIGAAEKVVGKVVLDVPDATGTLVYSNGGGTGWEWEYGAK
ncbi:hypothetical protein [Arthrobacter sp. YD2]|uniref:hypothetical protein n=1 Tax=Arthrobacter sp. YD2 TaxID=3058046 RepID=UPI0025B51EA0|nr:hypothetical protein [Arthrobacter sp. YD2]MDN3905542.1 hypothetical protein [Arthrobacter sp. YD2]